MKLYCYRWLGIQSVLLFVQSEDFLEPDYRPHIFKHSKPSFTQNINKVLTAIHTLCKRDLREIETWEVHYLRAQLRLDATLLKETHERNHLREIHLRATLEWTYNCVLSCFSNNNIKQSSNYKKTYVSIVTQIPNDWKDLKATWTVYTKVYVFYKQLCM